MSNKLLLIFNDAVKKFFYMTLLKKIQIKFLTPPLYKFIKASN